MSMLDSFFSKGFKAAKCKTLLKLTIPRIKLLRNRREVQLKQMRREIAKLLETGQEATARIRVEHIIREEKMMAAQEIVELFCELVAARIPIIEAQRECPLDLKEAISSICFAAPRCTDLQELLQVQTLFAGKYGKEFVAAATELMPECGVNRQLLGLLSVQAPPSDVKLKLLREIAEEHELDWDPSACESELLKPHEDLLKGPSQFLNGSNVETPGEKIPAPEPAIHENSESDSDFDIIDFPEVPTKPLQSNKGTISVPEMLPFPAYALSELDDEEEQTSSAGNGNLSHTEPVRKEDSSLKISTIPVEDKQFVPFICPPSQSTVSPVKEQHSHSNNIAKTENNINLDLEDVLAAAQAAAESAELAAVAARSAASIAQLRISELVKKNNDEVGGSTIENPFHMEKPCSDSPLTSLSMNNTSRNRVPSYDVNGDAELSPHRNHVINDGSNHHQPQRLPSMDEETVFSYPNLFTSKGSDLSSH